MEMKFYICERCGNIVAKVKDSGVPVMCCGQAMKELVPGTADASVEKHVPAYEVRDNKREENPENGNTITAGTVRNTTTAKYE